MLVEVAWGLRLIIGPVGRRAEAAGPGQSQTENLGLLARPKAILALLRIRTNAAFALIGLDLLDVLLCVAGASLKVRVSALSRPNGDS